MSDIKVNKDELKILLIHFQSFVEEDNQSCDYCKFCGMRYGNIALMRERGEKPKHHQDCEHLIAMSMSTGLL